MATPTLLTAVHVYRPESAIVDDSMNTEAPLLTQTVLAGSSGVHATIVTLSLTQVRIGCGSPETMQSNTTDKPAVVVTLSGGVTTLGATGGREGRDGLCW